MTKDKTLLRFRIYDGDREYTNYAIIDSKQLLTLNYKEIISNFFYDDNVDGFNSNITKPSLLGNFLKLRSVSFLYLFLDPFSNSLLVLSV